ncbi:MAG: nucleotidyltransferase family protein [Bacteroidales bacterium]|nr:nucleotidyltransferase family protein [Bacteroidales bacterium]
MKAMIFAAGLGTRLKPITDTLPKALVPVGGQPLLYHVITRLREAGYDELVVNVHHFAGQIREYLATHDFGLPISISDESDQLLETGGAIAHAKDLILPAEEPFLIHNVDILSNLDIPWFRSQTRPEALSTLLVSERETSRYLLFDGEMRLVGWTNVTTGEVRSPYPDLNPDHYHKLAFAGIHNISPAIFGAFEQAGFSGRFPIMDFYLQECNNHPIYGVVAEDLQLIDVGKMDSLAQAEEFYDSLAKNFQ